MTETEWRPIDTLPEGIHVLLWFPHGEKGNGGMEAATCFWNEDHARRDPMSIPQNRFRLSFWTHGGPNAGSDWEPKEMPTHWMPLPADGPAPRTDEHP